MCTLSAVRAWMCQARWTATVRTDPNGKPARNTQPAPYTLVRPTDETLAERLRYARGAASEAATAAAQPAAMGSEQQQQQQQAHQGETSRDAAVTCAAPNERKYANEEDRAPQPREVRIRKGRQYLTLEWDDPQHSAGAFDGLLSLPKDRLGSTTLSAELLRVCAPSTDVKGSPHLVMSGKRGLQIKDLYPVGNYALRIVFSDGHDAGIFPYGYLLYLGRNRFAEGRRYIRQLRGAKRSRNPPAPRARPSVAAADAAATAAAFRSSPGAAIGHPPLPATASSCSTDRLRG